ncbi:g_PROTEIN_RECEP_F1_2 domain-containing protein [Caerostris extrusa]|uniref:G_PROTEIN_RECEP_F1_2 domain-containing protein n=1 Tax=Caerostris extrusa TaxID=172846 RepID=A0AAV4T9Y9_CAEEX|nr:g_PROTEIN_RECEP_F1_2 domain-containing protein [Caerostris extrusa]
MVGCGSSEFLFLPPASVSQFRGSADSERIQTARPCPTWSRRRPTAPCSPSWPSVSSATTPSAHPLKAGYTCTQMRALAIIAVVWLVASLLTTPVFLTVHYRMAETRATGVLVPVCVLGVEELWQKLYYLAAVGLFYALPFAVLLVVYGHIARHLMAGSRMLASSSEGDDDARQEAGGPHAGRSHGQLLRLPAALQDPHRVADPDP